VQLTQSKPVFSDDEHFSAAGQAIVADYEFSLVQSDVNPTPLPAALPLFAASLMLGGLGFLRWGRSKDLASA
jgi:hypothetical protein